MVFVFIDRNPELIEMGSLIPKCCWMTYKAAYSFRSHCTVLFSRQSLIIQSQAKIPILFHLPLEKISTSYCSFVCGLNKRNGTGAAASALSGNIKADNGQMDAVRPRVIARLVKARLDELICSSCVM